MHKESKMTEKQSQITSISSEKLNKKEFAVQYTLYNVTIFIAWIFFIAFILQVNIGKILESYDSFRVASTIAIEKFISDLHFLWWIPLTCYFNFQITKKRLSDIGWSKWLSIFNFYPLLFSIAAIPELFSKNIIENLSLMYFIFGRLLPVIKLILFLILYLKPSKN